MNYLGDYIALAMIIIPMGYLIYAPVSYYISSKKYNKTGEQS